MDINLHVCLNIYSSSSSLPVSPVCMTYWWHAKCSHPHHAPNPFASRPRTKLAAHKHKPALTFQHLALRVGTAGCTVVVW
jgi:hypothetical protein